MFNKIQLTVFTLFVFVCCVVIFPIHCDLECEALSFNLQWKLGVEENGLNRNGSENNHTANKNKVNTVSCILLNILASIYRFESFT